MEMRAAARLLTVAALCFAVGLHWLALQSIAWTAMMVKYSQRVPLSVAVAQTFDGSHPCGVCHAVEKGQDSQKKSDFSVPGKLDLHLATPASARVIGFQDVTFPQRPIFAPHRFDAPPTPPPRSALV